MATIESLKTVLMEKASVDTEVISISIKRLCEADLLPSDPEALVNADDASRLLISVLGLQLNYAPAEATALWADLPMIDAKFNITIGGQFRTEAIDRESHFGNCDIWYLGNALADTIREHQLGQLHPSVEMQNLCIGVRDGHPFALLSVALGKDDNGAAIYRNVAWQNTDYRHRDRETELCPVGIIVSIGAQILSHFAEAIGYHYMERRPRSDKAAELQN